MKKFLMILSLVLNSPQTLAADVKEDVREPQTYKEDENKKDENYEDKKAAEEYQRKKEKKFNERTHKWMDRTK